MEMKKVKQLQELFTIACNNNVFSCGAVAFSKWKKNDYNRFREYYGFAQLTPCKKKLLENCFFDLASLTKALATVPVLLNLFDNNLLKPETGLGEIFSDCPTDKKKITIRQLMSHSSGLTAHRKYFNELLCIPEQYRKKHLLKTILGEKLQFQTGDNHCYSDLGFMLLGFIIEKITEKTICELSDSFYTPLKLEKHPIFPNSFEKHTNTYVDTGKCSWSKKQLSGLVHDENCRALGGVAGHAGLFGTLSGVMGVCEQLLNQWKGRVHHPAFSNRLLRDAFQRVGNSPWAMGFDIVSTKGSSTGRFFSEKSIGHLGFTGTSFWIDPEQECIVVLLTNRVYYGFENWGIKKFRPVLHDILMD